MDCAARIPRREKELTERPVESIFSDPFASSISCIPAVDRSSRAG